MFHIIIGQSGAGKTTYAKTNFLHGPLTVQDGEVAYTVCGNGMRALGRYGIGKRTEGTDTLAYNAKGKIKRQLKRFAEQGVDVLLEGDRINNRETLEYISTLRVPVTLYLLTCSVKTSMKRLRAAGSNISVSFVKATKTKSKKNYLDFSGRFNGMIVNTE